MMNFYKYDNWEEVPRFDGMAVVWKKTSSNREGGSTKRKLKEIGGRLG
ncbi:hypothetical protein GO998_19835 (plasmid) [Ralstonia syzygii]|uniref:Uncharacterized protein n=1 Tax=Ralstonia syzygii TaxID=28097 RepID=A0ABX7ZKY1_9RALS|nr:hypothetical protein [Ralstonia syzygii]QUP55977.1 hypothetical protein GO998_19835 [Ralstonia syzygii]